MKKFLFILIAVVCCALQGAAQDMRSLFLNAPDEIFPLLTKSNRADCIDYIDAGMEARVTNRLDGTSSLKKLTDDYFYMQASSSSWCEAKLFPLAGDTLICMIKGVEAEAADSRLLFYDSRWNRLDAEAFFEEPAIADFFLSADSAERYAERCDIYLVRYSFSHDKVTLKAEYTMSAYMNVDDAAVVAPLLRVLTYRWDGKRFIRE
ncbi:MAG: DUF3256 family protein [Bacteroidaceae bacterium]|nr:DUF3256 family protein [Bacteroidaceae bacterium]